MSNIIGVRNNSTIVPYSAATVTPAGTIIAYSGSIAAFTALTTDGTTLYYKDGWALCNGASISQTTFAQLYTRIATTWNTAVSPLTGSAQSAPTSGYFRIPNLQGTFLRGVGDFSDNTKDTTLAGFQADQLQGHEHNVSLAFGSGQSFPTAYGSVTGAGGTAGGTVANYGDFGTVTSPSDDGTSGTVRSGTETRSQNIGVYYLIKLYDNLAAVDVYIAPVSDGITGLFPALNTSLDNVTATRLGLKQYFHGTTYNGGNAPTVTLNSGGGTLSSVPRAVFVPYQCQDDSWRLRFNISALLSSTTRSGVLLAVNGILSKNISGFVQPVSHSVGAGDIPGTGFVSPGSNAIGAYHLSVTTSQVFLSGDIELNAKPTWAY